MQWTARRKSNECVITGLGLGLGKMSGSTSRWCPEVWGWPNAGLWLVGGVAMTCQSSGSEMPTHSLLWFIKNIFSCKFCMNNVLLHYLWRKKSLSNNTVKLIGDSQKRTHAFLSFALWLVKCNFTNCNLTITINFNTFSSNTQSVF